MSMKKLIKDFGDDYILVQDSQEIEAILDHIGAKEISPRPCSLFVKLDDGDYAEVWECPFIPYMMEYAFRLYPKGEEVED